METLFQKLEKRRVRRTLIKRRVIFHNLGFVIPIMDSITLTSCKLLFLTLFELLALLFEFQSFRFAQAKLKV